MISAFGVDHGAGEIEKALNPFKAFKAGKMARAAKATGGAHSAGGAPIFEQVAAKHGFAAPAAGGGKRIAAQAGKRKGSYSTKSFNPFGGGGRRVAGRGGARRA